MKCVISKQGQTKPGSASVTLDRGGLKLVLKCVSAEVCENCGEQYVDAETTARVLQEAERAAQAGIAVEVRAYVAA